MTRKIIRIVGFIALLSGLAFLAWFIPAKAGWFATDHQEMVERYAQPPSRFIEVDGVPIHVRVEGEGSRCSCYTAQALISTSGTRLLKD